MIPRRRFVAEIERTLRGLKVPEELVHDYTERLIQARQLHAHLRRVREAPTPGAERVAREALTALRAARTAKALGKRGNLLMANRVVRKGLSEARSRKKQQANFPSNPSDQPVYSR